MRDSNFFCCWKPLHPGQPGTSKISPNRTPQFPGNFKVKSLEAGESGWENFTRARPTGVVTGFQLYEKLEKCIFNFQNNNSIDFKH